MKSIMQTECECYLCGRTDHLDKHHVVGGANRDNSEHYGLTVYLCRRHHEMIHLDQKLDESVKKHAQEAFEKTHTHDEWMSVFHKNYL